MYEEQIVAHSSDISLDNVTAQKADFCTIWPNVKAGLEVLQGLVKNPFVKVTVGGVIALGEGVKKQVCG